MKAKDLQKDDVVIFPNGNVAVVLAVWPEFGEDVLNVYYDVFKTRYLYDDELLVARKGRVL